jgi:NADH-quinone oxidoreductase subunit E
VLEAAHQATGAEGSSRSADGLFSVHEEECLGVCEMAPVAQVNVANHDFVTPERMREIVDSLRAGEVPEPSRGPAVASYAEASRLLAGLEPRAAEQATA